MKVVGIDLSTKKIAIVVTDGSSLQWLEIESSLDGGADPRRREMFNLLMVEMYEPWLTDVEACHIEDISFLRSRRNELDMSKVQGGIEYAYRTFGVPCFMWNNMTVKALFKLNRKGKEAVKSFVEKRFGVEVPSYDVADATITALYGLEHA